MGSAADDRRDHVAAFGRGFLSRGLVIYGLGLAWLLLFAAFFFSHPVGRNQTPRLELLFLLPEILGANFTPADDSGWRYLPQRFDLLAAAGWVVGIAFGVGHLLLWAIGIAFRWPTAEGIAFTLGLGLSAWSLVTLGLGLAGWLSIGVFMACGAAIVISAFGLERRRKRATLTDDVSGGLRRPARPGDVHRDGAAPVGCWLRWGVLTACAPFVLAMLLGSLLPTIDFDVKEYHLGGPKEYFQAGQVQFLSHNVYTSFPFLTEMLSLAAMVIQRDWLRGAQAGQAVLMCYALITALGAFVLTRRLAGERAAWCAVLILLSTPWVYRISVIAYTEGALAAYLVLTTLALVRWVECTRHTPCDNPNAAHQETVPTHVAGASIDSRHTECAGYYGWLWLTGLMAGSAAATKYPGVLSAVIPVGLAVVAVTLRRQALTNRPRRRVLTTALVYSAGVLLAFGPWLIKNLVETGNPVYPLVWSVFGGESFDAATNVRWQAAHGAPTHLFSQPGLILPDLWERIKDIALRSDWQSPLLCSLAPLSLLTWRRVRGLGWLWLYIAWLFFTWCWLTHRIDRFWVPMIPLLAVLAGIGLQSLLAATEPDHDATSGMHPALLRLALWSVVGLGVLFNLGFNTTGLAAFGGYLMEMDAARDAALGQVSSIRVCNAAELDANSKVLFVGEAAHFEAEFPYVYHTVFDASPFEAWCAQPVDGKPQSEWPLRDPAEIRRTLQEQGITHLCINWLEIIRYRLPGSYGYTDFVHPDRFAVLEAAGLIEPTPFNRPVLWSELDPAQRQEINRWAPALRVKFSGEDAMRAIELYRVR